MYLDDLKEMLGSLCGWVLVGFSAALGVLLAALVVGLVVAALSGLLAL